MYGAIIGAAAGVAGSVISGINSAKEKKKYQNALLEAQRDAQGRADKYEYMTPQMSASYQNAINDARSQFDDYIKRREGQDAIMGTDSSSKARAEAAQAMGKAIATANASEQSRLDNKAYQARTELNKLNSEEREGYLSQAQQNALAGSNALEAGMGMTMADAKSHLDKGEGLFESMFKK